MAVGAMLRTASVSESAAYIAQIAKRETRRRARYRQTSPGETAAARAALDVLAAIPGVGDHRARMLVNKLGSVRGVMLAEEAELRGVDGIGASTARRIQRIAKEEESGGPPETLPHES